MGRAVWIVFDALHFGGNAVLVAAEINHTVVVLVPATFVSGGDMPIVVTTRFLELRLQQGRIGITLVQMISRNLHHATTAWGSGFHFDNSHD